MTSIQLKAFVHQIDSSSIGLLYAKLNVEESSQFIRISSAHFGEKIEVITFEDEKSLLSEAELQCRLDDNLVKADEEILETMEAAAIDLLLDALRVHHPYLFEINLEVAC